MKIIECVPNFSEGWSKQKILTIATALTATPGVKLLDICMDKDHNRGVLTFIGPPEALQAAALAVCSRALEMIDMREHAGVHPRIGAVDVVPFIPLGDADMQDAIKVAHAFGRELSQKNQIPVYFYGEAAMAPWKKELSDIRRGGYEALKEKMQDPQWLPDAGPAVFHERSGATAVGARIPLIAFNINLKSDDLSIAQNIAKSIRQSDGGFPHVKALGIPLKSRRLVQVSMNLTDYRVTSIQTVFDRVRQEAARHGIDILESELIGLLPRAALADATAEYLKLKDFSDKKFLEAHFD